MTSGEATPSGLSDLVGRLSPEALAAAETIAASAPPLTAEQYRRLQGLLRSSTAEKAEPLGQAS